MSVLGKKQILRRFDDIFPGRKADERKVKAAKYYLTLSGSFLILPSGRRIGRTGQRHRPLVLEPGQTAYVSSVERVAIPLDLVGIIGPRFSGAEQGLFFFGGMLVDPGWGIKDGKPVGEPLSFTIANLGHSPIELRPDEDAIASLAFMKVKGASESQDDLEDTEKPIHLREELFNGPDKPCSALGLVEELGAVRDQVDELKNAQTQVTLLVVVVLAASLFAGMVAAILGFSSDDSGASELSSGSLEAIGWGFGLVLLGVLGVVALFYFVLFVRNRWTAHRRGHRLRG